MADLTTDQMLLLARDGCLVLLWAAVALALSRRLHEGEWAALALIGSIGLLASSGVSLVQAKFLFVDHDPSLTLTLADWHLSRVPMVVGLVSTALVAKAVLSGRRRRARGPQPL